MKNRKAIFILALLFQHMGLFAQKHEDLTALLERLTEQQENVPDMEVLYEQVENAIQHPLDINKADLTALMTLPLMDELLAQAILDHKIRSGDYLSLLELQVIRGVDREKFMLLEKMLTCRQADMGTIEGKRIEVLFYNYRVVQLSDGYTTGDSMSRFSGVPWRSAVRFRYRINKAWEMGLSLEKDAGEPFFNRFASPDHIGGYAHYQNKQTQVIIGDFQAGFAQGVALSSGGGLGKSSLVLQVKARSPGLKPYRTWNEGTYFKGIGCTQRYKNVTFKLVLSAKNADAGLDSGGNITSLPLTGLHRNPKERAQKNRMLQTTVAFRAEWGKRFFRGGLTLLRYQEFAFPGKWHLKSASTITPVAKAGIDYQWNFRNVQVFSELCMDNGKHAALVSGCLVSLGKRLDLAFLYRNYSPQFNATLSNGFSEFSGTTNEHGLYSAAHVLINSRITLTISRDVFFRKEPAYRADFPQRGNDLMAEINYRKSRSLVFYLRVQGSHKERNRSENPGNMPVFLQISRYNYRFHVDFSSGKEWSFRTRLEHCRSVAEIKTTGTLVYQDILWKPAEKPFEFTFRYAVFRVPSYDARIYAYENDVLYTFLVPAYSGTGSRYYMIVKYSLAKNLDTWIKYSSVLFENTESISSGLDKIQGNKKQELKIQIRWQW